MFSDHMKDLCFLGALGAATLSLGGEAHRHAALDTQAQPLLAGQYQRQYEAHFDTSLPGSSLAIDAFAALRFSLLGELSQGAVLGQGQWLFSAEEPVPPDLAEPLLAQLHNAQTALAAQGVTLLPIILPDKARLHADRLPMQRSDSLQVRYDQALYALRDLGLPALDLRATMGAAGFMRTDSHWHPGAAQAVALRIADQLGQGTDPFITQREAAEWFLGDLSVFAQTGRFRNIAAVAHEKLPLYRTALAADAPQDTAASLTDLFGSVDIPVTLVGTSYSAKEQFHFEGFLKSALQMDVLNVAQVGQGPFQPMRDYLASDDLRDQPPQVVIWEIPERYIAPSVAHSIAPNSANSEGV